MNRWSSDLLEFEALRELLGRYVSSPLGREKLLEVAPGDDRAEAERILVETAEAIDYLRRAAQPQPATRGAALRLRFDNLPDPAPALRKLRIEGAVLDAREILDLVELLDRASDARAVLTAATANYPRLSAHAAAIGDFRPVLRELQGKILPDGMVADHASPLLGRLRRDIEKQQKAIHSSLERFLRAHREDGVLQEEFVTIRNERFVVPVVAGRQGRIDGVVHGSSGSGHTLFVEPLETIELNNELVRLNEEELREVHRILRELTDRLRTQAVEISTAVAVMGEIEVLFAKGQFGVDFNCVIPVFSPAGKRRLALSEARHPLLEDVLRRQRKSVVPVSLALDESSRTLLISGPNTGGKTVAMKTAGLMALMAQAGLPLSCTQAELPWFDQVLADIGDNQSIQESLSSFSAHVRRVGEMLDAVSRDSLVLLDELGRATDPEEGGALGVAILDRFRAAGAFTLASTHLLALKVFGATTAGVANGSMGFDDATLDPTYVLRLGAPGKSAGLDIASRLGLPPELVERARAALGASERDFGRLLDELHERLENVERLERELAEQKSALAAREHALEKEWTARETAKLKEIEQRSEQAIANFERAAGSTIDEIRQSAEQRKAPDKARQRVARVGREFREEMQAAIGAPKQQEPAAKIEEGSLVRLKNIREPARVRRVLSGDTIEVEAGFMKLRIPAGDVLEVLPAAPDSARLPRNVTLSTGPDWNVSVREINVIGQRAEEACQQVDKFLDQAALASVDRVRIVHGHGMGVLKRAIAELLVGHPHVEKFYAAPQNEGGAGATLVELKGS